MTMNEPNEIHTLTEILNLLKPLEHLDVHATTEDFYTVEATASTLEGLEALKKLLALREAYGDYSFRVTHKVTIRLRSGGRIP